MGCVSISPLRFDSKAGAKPLDLSEDGLNGVRVQMVPVMPGSLLEPRIHLSLQAEDAGWWQRARVGPGGARRSIGLGETTSVGVGSSFLCAFTNRADPMCADTHYMAIHAAELPAALKRWSASALPDPHGKPLAAVLFLLAAAWGPVMSPTATAQDWHERSSLITPLHVYAGPGWYYDPTLFLRDGQHNLDFTTTVWTRVEVAFDGGNFEPLLTDKGCWYSA